MLARVVACPSLMFGRLPDDEEIETAVDIVLAGLETECARRDSNP